MYRYLLRPNLRLWLALVGTSTLVLGTAYAMVQQSTRQSVNDWPRDSAQLVKRQLEGGATAADAVAVVAPIKTNLKEDLAGFVIVTDDNRNVLASSLAGETPLPPQGVFEHTKSNGANDLSWQTASGVRVAMQALSYKAGNASGFIITGQSLQPYEERTKIYGELALAAWVAIIAWSWMTLLMPIKLPEKTKKK